MNNLQLAFMALCGIAFVIYLIWRSESVNRVTFLAREREADKKQEERDQDARDRRRMLYEADHYNEAASMEPFCGEGKKKRGSKQESEPPSYDPYSPIMFAAVGDTEPSRPSSHSSYSGSGGSFDGGGASGDWGGSSSGSSSSNDCASSSSDSGSSSCGSND